MRSAKLTRRTLVSAACVAGPMVISLIAHRINLPAGPSSSTAAVTSPSDFAEHWMPPKPTEAQMRAESHAAELSKRSIAKSLFYHRERQHAERQTVREPKQTNPTVRDPESLVVTSIVRGNGPNDSMALMNGKVRRVGDTVAEGWKISAIDPNSRTVSIRHAAGRVLTLQISDSNRNSGGLRQN